jgi:hypothetical protein
MKVRTPDFVDKTHYIEKLEGIEDHECNL